MDSFYVKGENTKALLCAAYEYLKNLFEGSHESMSSIGEAEAIKVFNERIKFRKANTVLNQRM